MDYHSVDFSQTPVEQVMRDAATELYQAAHQARGLANMKLQNPPANMSGEGFENQVAEALWDELLSHREAYSLLFACRRELSANAPGAKVNHRDFTRWSNKSGEACEAIATIQLSYSKVQDAAMFLPNSEGEQRRAYLELVADPRHVIEQEMVNALQVLKSSP